MPLNLHSHMLAGMHAKMHIRASMFASMSDWLDKNDKP